MIAKKLTPIPIVMSLFIMLLGISNSYAIMNGMESTKYKNGVVAIANSANFKSAYCSGAYVRPFIIATAAHCVIDSNGNVIPNLFVSNPGEMLNSSTNWNEVSKVFQVSGWKNITNYVDQDDIAFLTLRKSFGESIFDSIANLETLRNIRMGDQYVWHMGYGLRQYAGEMSSTPQLLGLMPHNGGISSLNFDSFIRTSGSSNQNTCPGDSGGPTFYVAGNKVSLLGVLTGGNGCTPKILKEYITTSFTISYYADLLNKAIASTELPPELPKDLIVKFENGLLTFSWTFPRSINDESLTAFEILEDGNNSLCKLEYRRISPYFNCSTEPNSGVHEYVLVSLGMYKKSNLEKYTINVSEGETKAGIAAAKAQADAAAKAQASSSSNKKILIKKITCVKGTIKKTITGTNPKCPTGYKIK